MKRKNTYRLRGEPRNKPSNVINMMDWIVNHWSQERLMYYFLDRETAQSFEKPEGDTR